MAGPPNFEKHLFISYAHIDNQPLTPDQGGWVSRFHESLEAMLSMRLGRRAEIWRDLKLSGNDIFADEIVAQFPKTALPDDKQDLIEMEEPNLINGLGGFSETAAQPSRRCRARDVPNDPTSAPLLNPFPGLRPFREDEEHLFFGRESQVDSMVAGRAPSFARKAFWLARKALRPARAPGATTR